MHAISSIYQRTDMARENPPSVVLEGWERYFDEMSSFLRHLSRQAGVANESYCEYAVEPAAGNLCK